MRKQPETDKFQKEVDYDNIRKIFKEEVQKILSKNISTDAESKKIKDIEEKVLFYTTTPKDQNLLQSLINCYQAIFSAPPWNEFWTEEEILSKINKELTDKSFLVILKGDKNFPVGGFCWGKILPINELENHIKIALKEKPSGIEKILSEKCKEDKILYFHEFAIHPKFRAGLKPVISLLYYGLKFGSSHEVYQTLFWTSPKSHIFRLAIGVGYEPIFTLKLHLKGNTEDIVFLFHPDFSILLEATKLSEKEIAKLMRVILEKILD